MAVSGFTTKCNNDLQDYLKRRGITTTKLNKSKLIELCEAVEKLNLPLDPDFLQQTSKQDIDSKLKFLDCEDPFRLDGFTSCFDSIPTVTLYDIFNYLLKSKAEYDKRSLKAYKSCEDYKLFFDGHVEHLQYNCMGNSTTGLFRAKVKPTQREKTYLNKDHYDLWVAVGKQYGEVKCGYCTCIGGADGACRHLAAVLYEIEAFEVKSVTDGDNQWKKRPRQHDCPVPVKRLKIAKPKFEMNIQHKDDEGFDPRADQEIVDAEKMKDFANALKEISPSIQALDLLQTSFESDDMAEVDQHCVALSMEKKCQQFVQDNNYNFMNDVPLDICKEFVNKLSISDKDIDDIQACTIGQSKNPNWVLMRKGVITASNFRRVCECVLKDKTPPSLIKTLLGQYGEAHSAPLIWGRNKEQCAMKMYNRISKKKHACPKIEMQGLKMNKDKPFTGCSVDGILKCKCKDHDNMRVVEIKCPYSDRDKLPKEVALGKGCKLDENGNFYLSEDSEYYHQVQGQMGIYNCKSADLVIYTKLGIQVVEGIEFDSIFFRNMMSNIESYFKNVLLKEMLIKHD